MDGWLTYGTSQVGFSLLLLLERLVLPDFDLPNILKSQDRFATFKYAGLYKAEVSRRPELATVPAIYPVQIYLLSS